MQHNSDSFIFVCLFLFSLTVMDSGHYVRSNIQGEQLATQ